MANLTDADKVLRNDTGKDIVTKLDNLITVIQESNTPDADHVTYDNTESGLSADDVQSAIDEVVDDLDNVEGRVQTAEGNITRLDTNKLDNTNPTSTGDFTHTGDATVSGSVTTNTGFVGNLTGDVSGNAGTVNNHSVNSDVPANAVFTDTDELADLKDVDFVNLTDGQVIVWNATENKFTNITLPDPMVFRGSLGTGGTITALPVDGSATIGDTYKVITDGTYAGQVAKVGDTFICLTKALSSNTWVYIPSGDEPSGTVTSIKIQATSPIVIDDDSAITTSGTRTLSLADSGATAGSYGDSSAQTPNYGDTFKVPYITVDTKGRITGISEHTVKIPNSDNTDTQSDWNEIDTTSPAYINNKPTIPAAQVNSDWNSTSGVSEILHKPTIPTKTSELQNDSGFKSFNDITSTLTAGSTSITLSDASITATSTIDIYTSAFGVQPTNEVVTSGQIVLTFLAQASDISVKVRVS